MRASLLLFILLVYLAHAPQAQGVFGPRRCKGKLGYCRSKCQSKQVELGKCSTKAICCGISTGTSSSQGSHEVPVINSEPALESKPEPQDTQEEEATMVSE
ncbi:defensin-B4 [Ornithorhynchus anatinus]|uniref:Defensin-B4 n=1 Tax=Ornithorhynchus anatinus TaxID=9258 RepID=DEFB4_ORNAN|nr:defensin-B4 [Ornithorhynchus anatinus]P0C8A8.1 RecName: Full=Defensin-B4; Short=DefB4; Short=OaDefB4; Flags: Precursor [Ornithorhynchus anatinus]